MAYVIRDLALAERRLERLVDGISQPQAQGEGVRTELYEILGLLRAGQVDINYRVAEGRLLDNTHEDYAPRVDEGG